ncbi:hypothetical protein D6855_12925 [Butyrivibrio sp. CB08]|uniref:hypothetical protein n=1 Tax=Butyrivibrio sp. CB08 TaxID=2364879 RepID=UPI000EA8718E|nr:hypothetical protein [Butyrivibrio sp. CB08]RKM57944.1 hypothetical protein D6855_12925 [Butyrivibrio sp. CB08]
MSESKQMLFAKNLICVCINDNQDADYQGVLYHQYADGPIEFNGTAEMVIEMEKLFDEWDFPQRGLAERKFDKKKENHSRPVPDSDDDRLKIEIISDANGVRNVQNKKGKLGTFVVQVVFRQDATWQGHVIHQEENEKIDFGSALELIRIMDRALTK